MPVVAKSEPTTSHSLIIDFESLPIRVLGAEAWSIQFVWTEDAIGTFFFENSHDGTNWVTDTTIPVVVNGLAGADMRSSLSSRIAYDYIRIKWVAEPGSLGSVSVSARVIGSLD